jgi:hypothetical protein
MTFSADGTCHRNVNYNSRHVNLKAESYNLKDGAEEKSRVTRFFGIQSSLDASSEQAMKDWDICMDNVVDIYNRSPFGKRTGNFLRTIEILLNLCGMHSDHCKKEKKDAQLMEQKKVDATYQVLGEKEILESSNEELLPHFLEANKNMIESVGGKKKWDNLPETEKKEHLALMMEQLIIKLGKEAYEMLSDHEKKIMKLFIWAGCGCHKDLNTVQGGYAAAMQWWIDNDVEPPVLLANRDNAAVLKEMTSQNDVATPAQERAFDMTSRGAIKAAKIAGEILNNKFDKKGYHDVFRWWWKKHVGIHFTFPDTSNTRFQSFCEAAAVLLLYLPFFIQFLEFIRDRKQNKRFSHMEQNLWDALHCTATKTEFAVLALYAQAITHPYMRVIRAPGDKKINMLDLGPFHAKISSHITRIIEDPSFLVGPNVTHETGAMDGEPWQAPEVISEIQKMAPELPHLKPLLVAFFKGASETWKRFTSEFAPGGLIDEATEEEKDLAWMPATNDVNEGALGSFRVLMRRQPQLTLLQYNAQAMFHHNNTKAFMEKNFQADDYKFVHQMARESRGEEKKRREEMVLHAEAKIAKQAAATKKRKAKAAAVAQKIAGITLILDREEVVKLKGQALKDHLKAFQAAGAPNLKSINLSSKVAIIREGLQKAVDLYLAGEWKPIQAAEENDNDGSDSGEEIEIPDHLMGEGNDSDWEDVTD